MNDTPKWKHDGIQVVPGGSLDPNTAQTPGMDRKTAINFARAGARKLWAGTVSIYPNAKTGAHHHGALESVIYVVRGKARMRCDELQVLAPAHAGLAADHIDHAFQRPVVMRPGLGIGVNADRTGPDLLGADASGVDRSGSIHARGLRRVRVELIAFDHPHAVVPPVHRARGRCLMVMLVLAHRCFLRLVRPYYW